MNDRISKLLAPGLGALVLAASVAAASPASSHCFTGCNHSEDDTPKYGSDGRGDYGYGPGIVGGILGGFSGAYGGAYRDGPYGRRYYGPYGE